MSQQNLETFERGIDAINRRDIDALLEELDPEVEWHDVFGVMLGGGARTYQGREGVRELFHDLYDAFAETYSRYSEVRDLGNRTVAFGSLRALGNESGATIESPLGTLVEWRSGKAIRVQTFLNRRETLEAAGLDGLLAEQIAYYRARAPEYYAGVIDFPGDELEAALHDFRPGGRVLELACGPGGWTKLLLEYADSITAIDASPEMLALAADQVEHDPRVRFVEADLFDWRPDGGYDVVFFGFWLSHVPLERFESFWSTVAEALAPNGRVFFADDAYRTPDELIEGEGSSTIGRRLSDGTSFRAVKVPHTPAGLERRLRDLGWRIEVRGASGPFFWGSGSPG